MRTKTRDRGDEPKRSRPSSWRPRFISVLVTVRALRDTQRVTTIIPPARRRSHVPVRVFPWRADMVMERGASLAAAVL